MRLKAFLGWFLLLGAIFAVIAVINSTTEALYGLIPAFFAGLFAVIASKPKSK